MLNILLLFVLVTSTVTETILQYLHLFSERSCHGETIKFHNDDTRNFPKGWDDRAQSIRITGSWALYEYMDYNTGNLGYVEYYFSSTLDTCIDLAVLREKASSARQAGAWRDFKQSSLEFFTHVAFQGGRTYSYVDYNIPDNFPPPQSLILSGMSSWSLYDQQNFEGRYVCLCPDPEASWKYKSRFFPILTQQIPFDFTVRSIKKGCIAPARRANTHNWPYDESYDEYM